MKIRFLLPARRELKEGVRYYNARRERLGDEFRDEAWETLQRIKRFPDAWYRLSDSVRRCQLNRFPYGFIYAASEHEIVIIAIAHNRRALDYWRSRTDER